MRPNDEMAELLYAAASFLEYVVAEYNGTISPSMSNSMQLQVREVISLLKVYGMSCQYPPPPPGPEPTELDEFPF